MTHNTLVFSFLLLKPSCSSALWWAAHPAPVGLPLGSLPQFYGLKGTLPSGLPMHPFPSLLENPAP